jgi:hypothetical protein
MERSKTMDSETFEVAKDNDLTLEEAEEIQDLSDENGLDTNDALEIFQEL